MLAIREVEGPLCAGEGLRELLHDAAEFMLGWDCIAPLKPQLGEPFRILDARLQAAVDARYRLPAWTPEACAKHKRADRLAAASEAIHVVGWSLTDLRRTLGIEIAPLLDDPLAPRGFAPWEPWPPPWRRGCSWSACVRSSTPIDPLSRPPGRLPTQKISAPSRTPKESTAMSSVSDQNDPQFEGDPSDDAAAYDEWAAIALKDAGPQAASARTSSCGGGAGSPAIAAHSS